MFLLLLLLLLAVAATTAAAATSVAVAVVAAAAVAAAVVAADVAALLVPLLLPLLLLLAGGWSLLGWLQLPSAESLWCEDDAERCGTEVWLRTMVHDAVADYISVVLTDTADQVAPQLQADIEKARAALAASGGGGEHGCLRLIVEDLQAVVSLLSAWSPDTADVVKVANARTHFDSKRMNKVLAVMRKGAFGPIVLSNAATVIQTSVQDVAGDDKFRMALDRFSSAPLPNALALIAAPRIANYATITSKEVCG